MLGMRTPTKKATSKSSTPPNKDTTEGAGPRVDANKQETQVRRSIGEIEARMTQPRPKKTEIPKQEPAIKLTQSTLDPNRSPIPSGKYRSRTAEAKACLLKAKIQIEKSRNLKTDIKEDVLEAVERLYKLVKEAEEAKQTGTQIVVQKPKTSPQSSDQSGLTEKLEEHAKQLAENSRRMKELREELEKQRERAETVTYANVAANRRTKPHITSRETLHSVVVTSTDETDTGEEVLDRVRKVVDAKEGWITVQRIRKARDRKVIMGFKTVEEQTKIKERLAQTGSQLRVEEVKNKDPMFVLRDVLSVNTDEDVIRAIRNQNRSVFDGLDEGENRLEIKYRKRARNPLTGHVVVSTSPKIWRRAVEAGTLHIDLQRVRVADQSPLVQCSRCLEYGHGRRFCKETVDLCSHCGGPHLKMQCPEFLAGTAPACRNCVKARYENTEHNAFSGDCPVRQRWDKLARTAVAYC